MAFDLPVTMRPRWRDVPGLARLMVRRFGNDLTRRPGYGRFVAVAATVLTAAMMVAPKISGRLAAVDVDAMMWFQPVYPRTMGLGRRIRGWLATALMIVLIAALAIGGLFAIATLHPTGVVAGAVTEAAIFGTGLLGSVALLPGPTAWQERRLARSWARVNGYRLIQVNSLAGIPGRGAAVTVLVRRLLAVADHAQVAVIALPRNGDLVILYQRLGFVGLSHHRRLLTRLPR